jgi:hypothetical protein
MAFCFFKTVIAVCFNTLLYMFGAHSTNDASKYESAESCFWNVGRLTKCNLDVMTCILNNNSEE